MSILDWLNPATNPILNPGAALLNNSPVKPGAPHGAGPPNLGAQKVGSPFSGFGTWLLAFGVLTGIIVFISDSDKYSEVGEALMVVILVGFYGTQYDAINTELKNLFGSGS